MATNPDWLSQVVEPALEPELAIVDAHHHLWSFADHPYELREFSQDLRSGHNIKATVFVECTAHYLTDGPEAMKPVGETRFVNAIADDAVVAGGPHVAAGIVGFADLTLGDAVDEVFDAHIAAAPRRFRGIRHAAGYDPHPDIRNSHSNPPACLLGSDAFRRGFARLSANGLSFDAWLYHPQIGELTALARAFPDTLIVLDHFGGPLGVGPYDGQRQAVFERWKTDIAMLADCPNVYAKLGGLNMAVNGFGWHKRTRPPTSAELAAATRDYYLHTIDCFSPARCLFESNFPVDKLSCSYGVLWNSFKILTQSFTVAERARLFYETAAQVYRLNLP